MTRYDTLYDCTAGDCHELLLVGADPDAADLHGLDWVMDRFARIYGRTA